MPPTTRTRHPLTLYCRPLADGRWLGVDWHGGHTTSLWIGTPELIDDLWLYADVTAAVAVARTWDGTGEPPGWTGHPRSGRTHAPQARGED